MGKTTTNTKQKLHQTSPYVMIIVSFAILIVVGTILLSLGISSSGTRLSFIDAFFLSTSAVTITGLSPLLNVGASLSLFGKIVLALLIQIGGLSVITLGVFIMIFMGVKFNISDRYLFKESLNQNSAAGIIRLVKKIVLITISIELFGTLVNLIVFAPLYPFMEALGYSVFHAISSFNNAGFDIFGVGSLIAFKDHPLLILNTAFLIMSGGIGFLVISDIFAWRKSKRLSNQTRIVLFMNLLLWISGFLLLKLTNLSNNNFNWFNSFFLSVSARTAGFSTLDLTLLSRGSLLILMALMFIGASPVSTGGGIKVTTFFVIFKSITSFASGKEPTVNKRLIPDKTRQKAFILLILAVFIIFLSTMLLLILNAISFEAAFIETISGFANVGLSLNITPTLDVASKIIIALVMFSGRVGPLTLVMIVNKNWYKKGEPNIRYLEEKLIIG